MRPTASAPSGATARARQALDGAAGVPYWLDTPDRPAPRPPLDGDVHADLLVVGGGLTGLWTAVLAAQRHPNRSVVLVEAAELAWAASGRNGGFCSASLTHGLANGLDRWPADLPTLLRMGADNLDAIEAAIRDLGIDCGFRRTGELTVAVQDWQVRELAALRDQARRLGEDLDLLDGRQAREAVDSPTYRGALRDPRGTALLDPARLVWGLARAAERLGVAVHERTRVLDLADEGDRVRAATTSGTVRARSVVLGTSAFPSPLRRVRPYVVPVWDHVLVTEPLPPHLRDRLGWAGGEGLSDAANQFHYYRLVPTPQGDRILWGGYDALYYFGSDLGHHRARRPRTEELLAEHLLATFPQLEGIRFTHAWGGAIDTCTRFAPFWRRAHGGRTVAVQGYTGLGVGASRFGAAVALDLLDGEPTERTALEMVRRGPLPFPPEPARWAGIQLTRRSIARADARGGRRDLWLRTLDRLGLGFDS